MLSFKRTVCVAVTLLAIGCDRNGTQASPESTGTVTGPRPTGPADSATGTGSRDGGALGASVVGASSATANGALDAQADTLSDQQIAAVTEAANEGEIAQGKVAQTKARNPKVKAFADKMVAHHGQAKEKQSKLDITSADSPLSKQLKDDGAATLASLKASPAGAEFDQTYIKAQVDGHQKVLDTINDRLLPAVKNDKLAAYVKDIKATVEAHLKEARDIEQSLTTGMQAGAAGAGNQVGATAAGKAVGTTGANVQVGSTGVGIHGATGIGTQGTTGSSKQVGTTGAGNTVRTPDKQ